MSKTLLVVFALVATAFAASEWEQFEAFVSKYEKTYANDEEKMFRFSVFQHALGMIEKMNIEHMSLGGEAVFGVNSLADLTREEFTTGRLMTKMPYRAPQINGAGMDERPTVGLLAAIDWRNVNGTSYVTAVKDQGQCGSCWAHSADEAEESFDMIYNKRASPQVLSVQQCTACTYSYNGCNGGWPHDAYLYAIEDRNGIDSDAHYPYSIPAAGTCKFGSGNADAPVTRNLKYNSPTKGELETVLSNNGPVSVCVAAESWQYYTGGILKSCSGSVDHCVQAVGYDTTVAEPYWNVRNSWGTGWGEKGYIRLDMATNSGDICHIQEYMTYPIW